MASDGSMGALPWIASDGFEWRAHPTSLPVNAVNAVNAVLRRAHPTSSLVPPPSLAPPPEAEALQRAVPAQRRPFASRCASDAAGVPVRVEVRAEDAGQGEDTWLELADPLELEVLERVVPGASASAARLATDLAAESEGSVTEEDVIERLIGLSEAG